MLEHPNERPQANLMLANMRDRFLMAKALVIALESMSQVTDIRDQEPSDMADMAALAKCPLFEVFTEIVLLAQSFPNAKVFLESIQVAYIEDVSNE
jgi:hypothetical protein